MAKSFEVECGVFVYSDEYRKVQERNDAIREKWQTLGSEPPKDALEKLPEEMVLTRFTFDPLEVSPYYEDSRSKERTIIFLSGNSFLVNVSYDKVAQMKQIALKLLDDDMAAEELRRQIEDIEPDSVTGDI